MAASRTRISTFSMESLATTSERAHRLCLGARFFHPDDLERVGREIQELLASDGQEWKNSIEPLTRMV
jgi:hypothetical protein